MEVPKETYERLTGQPWPGGRSAVVEALLKLFQIEEEPGTAGANLRLQAALLDTRLKDEPRSVVVTEESGMLRMSHHPSLGMTQILGMLYWALESYAQTKVNPSSAGAPPMELLAKMAEAMRKVKVATSMTEEVTVGGAQSDL